ncbi:UDP-forming cellulose synthase catalytic subunit [Spongiibacter taiwanensis]|uniref:UDP-forming cellulose synthase catalytic subunit n=1 Tax=Spongiibacter taiwanensis TaxID=1748242 RepID=UPI002035AEAC|nr:UDP-forming cellulose synthase catalytic subunit [Spongiibacter taiwanensis]USA42930.1 UDP-forming cellulose synthase catalytic subunit [Spongiibacter taiwanensis]
MERRQRLIGWRLVLKPEQLGRYERRFRYFEKEGVVPNLFGRLLVGYWLVLADIFLQPTIKSVESWQWLPRLFPQINFSRPVPGDLLRFAIQTLWLLFVQDRADRAHRVKQVYRIADLRSKKVLFKFIALLRLQVIRLERRARKIQDGPPEAAGPRILGLLRWRDVLLVILVAALAGLCITVPFSLEAQAAFVAALAITTLVLRQIPGRFPSMLMIILSLVVSCRYIWWRTTSTLNWDDGLGLFLGLILLMAEAFAWLVLVLGYFQNIWPLNRRPTALPDNRDAWPSVDLFVPSYNEDLSVVQATVYACLGLDWPADKLNIYILDDGKRDSFKDFAASVGVHYIRRPTNEHAKAGNINYALKHTHGEYVAIFDCDHIPVRAFLQVCMGSFLTDPKLALVQTPHHFYSPDPFERNLSNFRKIPNEGNLFYGLIQDGNDLWNATFFCGSCAVIRRTALLEVGGIAVETVTEDAHTSLRLHRLGYRSAYLRAPISAGLATETLSAHVGQRIRWARGMAQILRLDNPLTGSGLKWQQRLCYFNAMLHFLSGIPRMVFLTAPLVFLLLHTYIIYAPAAMLLLYVIPHMFHASVVNSILQGKYRYSFWGEVYESVLSWYVARPTTVALFAPHKGKFNVTAKGGKVDSFYFDWVISKPYVLLVSLNVLGIIWGCARLVSGPQEEFWAVVINMAWTGYNLLILGAAVAVAGEMKQQRSAPRVEVDIPVSLRLSSGRIYQASLRDFSLGGMRIELPEAGMIGDETSLQVMLQRANHSFLFKTSVVFRSGKIVGLRLQEQSKQALVDYVQCTFARADNWVTWQRGYEEDRPGVSFGQVSEAGINGFKRLLNLGPWPLPQLTNLIVKTLAWFGSLRPHKVAQGVLVQR